MKSEGSFSGLGVIGALPVAVHRVLDFLLPPLCFGCGVEVETQGGLCPTCWSGLSFITKPFCSSCGFPFAHDMPKGLVCASCHQEAPAFDLARSALAYNAESRPLVLAFKHGGRTEGLKTMAKWMKTALGEDAKGIDLIVPVPLHGARLFKRTFNQSALLAKALSQEISVPHDPFLLKRTKNTKTQGGLTRAQRKANVRAAFKITKRGKEALLGKTALLIDDVLTTGATTQTCTKVLKASGAKKVLVLTLARVVELLKKETKTQT